MARITVEDCLEKITNRFQLVLAHACSRKATRPKLRAKTNQV